MPVQLPIIRTNAALGTDYGSPGVLLVAGNDRQIDVVLHAQQPGILQVLTIRIVIGNVGNALTVQGELGARAGYIVHCFPLPACIRLVGVEHAPARRP